MSVKAKFVHTNPVAHDWKRLAAKPKQETALNRPGFAHIAFAVEDVSAAKEAVFAANGSVAGDLVTVEIPAAGIITFVYAADPEDNIIELQQWAPS